MGDSLQQRNPRFMLGIFRILGHFFIVAAICSLLSVPNDFRIPAVLLGRDGKQQNGSFHCLVVPQMAPFALVLLDVCSLQPIWPSVVRLCTFFGLCDSDRENQILADGSSQFGLLSWTFGASCQRCFSSAR